MDSPESGDSNNVLIFSCLYKSVHLRYDTILKEQSSKSRHQREEL